MCHFDVKAMMHFISFSLHQSDCSIGKIFLYYIIQREQNDSYLHLKILKKMDFVSL